MLHGPVLLQGFNMAVQQSSTCLPESPAQLDDLLEQRLNSQLKASQPIPAPSAARIRCLPALEKHMLLTPVTAYPEDMRDCL